MSAPEPSPLRLVPPEPVPNSGMTAADAMRLLNAHAGEARYDPAEADELLRFCRLLVVGLRAGERPERGGAP